MSKKTGEATPDEKPAKDETPAEEKPAKGTTQSESSTDETTAPVKKEKSFTKTELDAAAKKAVDDAQKKWDDEKDLSENERLKKENEELRSANRLRDAKEDVVSALKTAGAKAADLAFDAISGKLRFDDAGKLVNAKDLIDGLKQSYPDQFGVEPPAGGVEGGAGQQQGTSSKLTAEKLAAMKPAEINALDWADVRAVLAG